MKTIKHFCLVLIAFAFSNISVFATGISNNQENKSVEKSASSFHFKSSIKYAKGFQIKTLENGLKEVIVWDPWNSGKIFQKYYLRNRGAKIETNHLKDGLVVDVPVRSIAALSSTQIGILKFLGVEDHIVAVSLKDRIYDEKLDKKAQSGEIQAVGHAETLNFEKIVEVNPDLVMVAGYMKINDRESKLIHAGLPVAFNIEWMESSPLARAEWAKFIAAFFNKEEMAETYFNSIEEKYMNLKTLVKNVSSKPTILSGYNFKGIWYMPGGKSYLAQFLRDARSSYYWFSDSTSGSIPLSFEVVYDKHFDSEIWFGPGQCRNMADLEALDERYKLFDSYKNKKVYCYTKRMNDRGANDWYESGVMRPDIVLKDIIKILHPEVLPEYELYFFQKLK